MRGRSVRSFLKRNWLLVLLASGIAVFAGVHILWYIHPSDVTSAADLRARINAGQPTIVSFYSNL
ncbi:MAG: hypothetical protein JW910_12360 [Anaerolineae bacterium]|nr:hypothetical protein [Anaerolineae bacterium]